MLQIIPNDSGYFMHANWHVAWQVEWCRFRFRWATMYTVRDEPHRTATWDRVAIGRMCTRIPSR